MEGSCMITDEGTRWHRTESSSPSRIVGKKSPMLCMGHELSGMVFVWGSGIVASVQIIACMRSRESVMCQSWISAHHHRLGQRFRAPIKEQLGHIPTCPAKVEPQRRSNDRELAYPGRQTPKGDIRLEDRGISIEIP